jgi:hypothetical protein
VADDDVPDVERPVDSSRPTEEDWDGWGPSTTTQSTATATPPREPPAPEQTAPPEPGPEPSSSLVDAIAPAIGVSTPEPPKVFIANETRARIVARWGDSALTLAPLEQRLIPRDDCNRLRLKPLELLGYVRTDQQNDDEQARRRQRAVFLALFFYGGLLFLIWGLVLGTSTLYWGILGLIAAAAAVYRLADEDVGVRAVQTLYLVIVLCVGVAMPVAAIWAGGNIDQVWDDAFNGTGPAQETATLTLLGRGIQTVFVIVVTLLPGLLYFLFDRYRLSTLAEEFTRQIFRLDRSVRTRSDIYAKYGHLMDEAYGRHLRRGGRSSRLQPGTRLPIIVATIVFALGWIVVLLNAEVDVEAIPTGLFRSLITPWQSATAFAFLGAYVFILQAALRAYLRGDLRPKFYSYAALRVVVAVVLAWVLDVMIPSDESGLLLVTAFSIGLVPETFLLRVREFVRSKSFLKELTEEHPLTKIEGCDVYDRARLEQEGVTNVEALAHSNLVELILQTRIPPGRLVDWTDQAHLYLHLHYAGEGSSKPSPLDKLHEQGIRTASDLLSVYDAARRRGRTSATALVATLGPSNGGPPLLRTVIDAIEDEEWIAQIRSWHDPKSQVIKTIRYPEDFAGGSIPSP